MSKAKLFINKEVYEVVSLNVKLEEDLPPPVFIDDFKMTVYELPKYFKLTANLQLKTSSKTP